MTPELTCPSCGNVARFRETYGPGDDVWLVCSLCGAPTDDAELIAAQALEVTDNYLLGTDDRSLLADMPGGMFPRPQTAWTEISMSALEHDRYTISPRFNATHREAAIAFLCEGSSSRKAQYTCDQRTKDGFYCLRLLNGGCTQEVAQ